MGVLDFDYIEWDEEEYPSGNVQHIGAAGLSPDEVEDVLYSPDPGAATSDSSGRPIIFGTTRTGKYIVVVYTVLSGTLLMLCSQAEQPFGRGQNFLLSNPRA
jgi:hypothetical protein